MKAVFIVYNQALTEAVNSIFDRHQIRGYTKWADVQGRGSNTGEPHFGNHTWPAMNSVILTIIEDEQVELLLASLKKLDNKTEQQGLRAFVWSIEEML
jgi:nitrogen regulatory protein PII